jgi:ABC-type sugar transport system ATPase subunit
VANVSLVDVEKRFGAHVVIPQLNLEIADGSFVVLVGPSGCGKTTTLNMIAGLEIISAGQLLIGGRDVTDVPPKAATSQWSSSPMRCFLYDGVREHRLRHEDQTAGKK